VKNIAFDTSKIKANIRFAIKKKHHNVSCAAQPHVTSAKSPVGC